MTANDKVVAGILGTGRIGRMHARNVITHLPDVFLKAVADCGTDDNWVKSMGTPACAADYREIPDDSESGKLGDIDTALITLRLVGGALCTIDMSRETHYGYDQQVEVFGLRRLHFRRQYHPDKTEQRGRGVHR